MNGSIAIRKVEKDTQLLADLIKFVEKGSWEEVKEHLLEQLRTYDYTDWECIFAAMDGDRIVGHATLLKSDYYP
ncbi:MAG: N-acetyltransferase, partial [Firmicutes bacterium]|nr:N-acetyltransferase [Bacillota bacterium]